MTAIQGREFEDYGDDGGSLREHLREAATTYDFDQFAPRGDITDKAGRAWSLGRSGCPHPLTPPTTPVTWDEYEALAEKIQDEFTRAVQNALWQMSHLGKRLGDYAMSPGEVADTARDWVQYVLTDCRKDAA